MKFPSNRTIVRVMAWFLFITSTAARLFMDVETANPNQYVTSYVASGVAVIMFTLLLLIPDDESSDS